MIYTYFQMQLFIPVLKWIEPTNFKWFVPIFKYSCHDNVHYFIVDGDELNLGISY